jgi:hypothetical protein
MQAIQGGRKGLEMEDQERHDEAFWLRDYWFRIMPYLRDLREGKILQITATYTATEDGQIIGEVLVKPKQSVEHIKLNFGIKED